MEATQKKVLCPVVLQTARMLWRCLATSRSCFYIYSQPSVTMEATLRDSAQLQGKKYSRTLGISLNT